MERLHILGGNKLKGEIEIEGAKNAVLPILSATILNDGKSIIKNCPYLSDVEGTLNILKEIGCKVRRENDVIVIDSQGINSTTISEKYAVDMRSSITFLGPMLARFKKVTISYPGEHVSL